MGEGPEAAGSLGERWGMRMRIPMKSLQSLEMWTVTLFPGGHLRIDRKRRMLRTFFFKLENLCFLAGLPISTQISRDVNSFNLSASVADCVYLIVSSYC